MYRDKFINQINKHYWINQINKHYWIGVFTGIGIGALYFLVPPMIDIFMSSPVNTYKGCDTKEKLHNPLDCMRRN